MVEARLAAGLYRAADLGRVLAISPHLDDAAMSCGAVLTVCPSPVVLTVFAGLPPEDAPLQPWDAACGFADGRSAMRARRAEDGAALDILGAHGVHLEFLDAQYGASHTVHEIATAIARAVSEADAETVLFPLGLFHSDHALVHHAALAARHEHGGRRWLAYEDALYRRKPGLLHKRLARLHADGASLTPVSFVDATDTTAKARAVDAYASQLHGVGLSGVYGDPATPEGYWRLEDGALRG